MNREYGKLNYIDNNSVLNYYINKITPIKPEIEHYNTIYPFRFNLSQKQAMENVYKSNISVIQGPPGTGKTQTILNIIANLAIMQNKTVAVVSNNNEAVKNVKDKLAKDGYDFIVADLGNQEKRKKFFEDVHQTNIENFKIQDEEKLLEKLDILNKQLNELLEKNNKKAILEKEILNEEFKDFKYEREILMRNLFKNLENLTEEEKRYVNNGARLDFVIYNNMDNKPLLFIEVDGFSFHKNNPRQLKKDNLKDSISKKNGINILRFETGEKSYNEEYIINEIKKKLNI